MTTALAPSPQPSPSQVNIATIEQVVINGNLAGLQPAERLQYYRAVCESVGLNPLTKPFEYITLNGKLVLYARRDASDQLRRRDKVSVTITDRNLGAELYAVTAQATTPDGRQDESIGAVCVTGLKGEALANALMKAETKAKRRVTLSICGLGLLDESEIGDQIDETPLPVQRPETRQAEPRQVEGQRERFAPANSVGARAAYITEPQVRRLFAIAREKGVTENQIREYIEKRYPATIDEAGKAHISRILSSDYDDVIDAVQSKFGQRQPGDE
jgi:hypothetical protein